MNPKHKEIKLELKCIINKYFHHKNITPENFAEFFIPNDYDTVSAKNKRSKGYGEILTISSNCKKQRKNLVLALTTDGAHITHQKNYKYMYNLLKEYHKLYNTKKLTITDKEQQDFLDYQEQTIIEDEQRLEIIKKKEQELIEREQELIEKEQNIKKEEERLKVKDKNLKNRLNKLNNRPIFNENDSNETFVNFFRQHLKITNNINDTLSKRDVSKYFKNINKEYVYDKEELYEFIDNIAKTKYKSYSKWIYLRFVNDSF
jgi:hypothetical protein